MTCLFVYTTVGGQTAEVYVLWQSNRRLGWAERSWLQHATDKIPHVTKWDCIGEGLSADAGRHTKLASRILV